MSMLVCECLILLMSIFSISASMSILILSIAASILILIFSMPIIDFEVDAHQHVAGSDLNLRNHAITPPSAGLYDPPFAHLFLFHSYRFTSFCLFVCLFCFVLHIVYLFVVLLLVLFFIV